MRLLDLDPRWIDREWDGRHRIGIEFKCTHCDQRLKIFFENPLDGGHSKGAPPKWRVTSGDTFQTLTLYPSIDWKCHMHVTLVNGEVRPS